MIYNVTNEVFINTKKKPRGTHAKHAADSAALGGVWALTTQDTEKPRRRMADGVPRPLVRARTRARNCRVLWRSVSSLSEIGIRVGYGYFL